MTNMAAMVSEEVQNRSLTLLTPVLQDSLHLLQCWLELASDSAPGSSSSDLQLIQDQFELTLMLCVGRAG